MKCHTTIRITWDNWLWILIRDDRNLSMHRQGLMRFKNSFSLYLRKSFSYHSFWKGYLSLNLNSKKKKMFCIFVKIHLPWYLNLNFCQTSILTFHAARISFCKFPIHVSDSHPVTKLAFHPLFTFWNWFSFVLCTNKRLRFHACHIMWISTHHITE